MTCKVTKPTVCHEDKEATIHWFETGEQPFENNWLFWDG
jgi:hypothetical protein